MRKVIEAKSVRGILRKMRKRAEMSFTKLAVLDLLLYKETEEEERPKSVAYKG